MRDLPRASYLAIGFAMNAMLGTAYAWSVFKKPLVTGFGATSLTAMLPFALGLAMFSVGMVFAGRLVDRHGPRKVAILGAGRIGEALISGDLLLEEISPNPVIEFAPDGARLRTLPALVRSLRRVEALAPAVAYPGHGEVIVGPAPRARELLRHHAERRERLAALLGGRPWTLRELAAAWYPDLDRFNLFLGLSEVLGHLDLLEDDGRLTVERRDGILHYTLS